MTSLDKTTIFCIVGPSGSGKTTLALHLEKELGIPALVSYTTRPIRANETDGVDHWFVKENEMPPKSEMLAYTNFNGYHYWTTISQVPTTGACSYVIDEKGLNALLAGHSKDYRLRPIIIACAHDVLVERVGKKRVARDMERIPYVGEDVNVLVNNGSLDEFLKEATKYIKKLID